MADRSRQRAAAMAERGPAAAAPLRRAPTAAPASPARALQHLLGSQGAAAVIARAVAPPAIQLSRAARLPANVSKPTDPAELEAEQTAKKVVRMPEPAKADAPTAGRAAANAAPGTVHRMPAASVQAAAVRGASAATGAASGSPLPSPVRGSMERRFGASFGGVRVHTGDAAARQSAALNAHALTIGPNIYFGRDKFQPHSSGGQELLAHELTHTIQQGASSQKPQVRRSAAEVTQRPATDVQRSSIFDIPSPRQFFANQARSLPGFTMLTVAIGYNPITNERVERSAGNILRGAIELIPGGALITDALNAHGVFDRVSQWAQTQFDIVKGIASTIYQDIENFISGFSVTDLASPGTLWDRAKAIVDRPIARITAFAVALKDGIVQLIKDAILKPIAAFAQSTSGYPLLCTVLGKDPISGEAVPQDAEHLLGGFMKFIGEEETWTTMQQANAIPRAFAWFKGAYTAVVAFVKEVPGLFVQALKSLEVADIILIPRAFAKLAGVFGGFAGRFISWGATAVWNLLEIIFDVVSPGALTYIKKTGAAIKSIFRNPLPFVGNLVKAARTGFLSFGEHFLDHLKAGLIDWLTGSLPGIYIPKAFSLTEIAKFVFSVLGLTWANIRQKLVKATSETVVKTLETGFDIVVALVRDGPSAAWEKIKEQLSNLKDMVIGGITDFVVDMVVKKAIPKLIAMFIPGAGFISAILSIYDTVMVFVNKIKQIIAVVTGFIDSIVAIAAGKIGAAAQRVESALAGVLSLAINFLAGFAGLGKVADKVMAVINKIRAPIDKALDWLVGWIVKAARGLVSKAKAGVKALLSWWKTKVSFQAGAESHSLYFQGEGPGATLVVASAVQSVESFLAEKKAGAKGDKVKENAIDSIQKLMKGVDKLKPKTKEAEDDAKVHQDIEKLMNQIGQLLVVLLADDEWGTERNPSPFDYPKRQAAGYPTFYLATGKLAKLSQEDLATGFAAQKGKPIGDAVYQYRPTVSTAAPDKSQTLGIAQSGQIQVGKKLLFDDKTARGSGVGAFKALVGKFGFVASSRGLDIDHVVELQLGGKDDWTNLWPLAAGENRSSGSIIKNSSIEIPKTKQQKPVKDAMAEKKKGQKPQAGLWLIIRATRQL
ncbi:MAG: DUF4157 domain-containing protein [Acidobacteriota bacterium]